jgi:hypothetical protein
MAVTLTDITATLGVVFGTGGLVLGILNYLRDRPKVRVSLKWNMETISSAGDKRECGVVTVTNTGRRPVYLSHVCLRLPKHSKTSHLLLVDSIQGRKSAEGDPPMTFIVPYDGLEKHSEGWKQIRAQVSDSTGRIYLSKRGREEIPTWAKKSQKR